MQSLCKGRKRKELARLMNIGEWADAKCVPGADEALARFVPTCQGKIAEDLLQTGRPKLFERGQKQRIFRNRRIAAPYKTEGNGLVETHVGGHDRHAELWQCR